MSPQECGRPLGKRRHGEFRLLSWQDPGHGRTWRLIHVCLIFSVLVLTCNAKITWEFFQSRNQARAIRALKISTSEHNQYGKSRKSLKRALRLWKSSTPGASERPVGTRLGFEPPTLEVSVGIPYLPSIEPASGDLPPQESTIALVANFLVLWCRPPPCAV